MDLMQSEKMARELMSLHLPAGKWTLEYDYAKGRMGCCRWRTMTIGLSAPLVKLASEDEVKDTILHEIAHALVGPGYGHGPVWKAMARKVGARPRASHDMNTSVIAKWRATCTGCGYEHGLHRMTRVRKLRGSVCGKCSTVLDFKEVR